MNDVVQQQLKASKDILSVSVGRETEPLNTFSENDTLLAGVAFNVFLLGRKGVGCKGSMSNVLVKHLLTHYTQQAGCDSQLCFTLFNQLQIHAATKSVSASVKAHPDVFAKFSAFQADQVAFEKRITAAIANPKSADAKALVTELQGMLKFSGARHVPYSSEARKSLIPQLYSYSQELNSGYVFVTISPHDVSDWRTLRLARRLDVPLTELQEDNAAMVGDSIVEVELDAEIRSRLVSANPAASAILFRQVVLVILEHIFGVKPCRSIRTSPLFGDGVVLGIFGTLTGFVGVIEVEFLNLCCDHFVDTKTRCSAHSFGFLGKSTSSSPEPLRGCSFATLSRTSSHRLTVYSRAPAKHSCCKFAELLFQGGPQEGGTNKLY